MPEAVAVTYYINLHVPTALFAYLPSI
jgi:hypothetical protein